MTELIAISNSEIACWDRCRRKWYLAYYMGMVPADEIPFGNMQLGIRVHAALEGWYGYQLDPVGVLRVLYELAIQAFPDFQADLEAERETAVIMVSGYLDWVAETGADAELELIATETDLQVPFPKLPGVALRARMDQVVLDHSVGVLRFLDHKTAANFDAHDMMALDPQFKFYSIVHRLLNHLGGRHEADALVSGGIRNTLRRVKRTSRSSPPYYQRDTFTYNDEELDAAEARVFRICTEILDARSQLDYVYDPVNGGGGLLEHVNGVQRADLYPTPRPHECRWDCPFVNVCPMMDDGSDWPGVLTRSGRYKQDDPYQYYREDPLRAVREVLGQ